MPRLLLALACTLLTLPCVGPDAHASDRNNRLPEAVNRIERETGGRVLSAERRTRGGREVSRIKVYTPEGRIRILWDDPQRDREAARDPAARRERAERPGYERGRGVMPRNGDAMPRSGGTMPRSGGAMPRSGDDGAVVQRGFRPEPTPLSEPASRRDDGTPPD